MLRWTADEALSALIWSYYAGEARAVGNDTWSVLTTNCAAGSRSRPHAHTLRLRARGDGTYDILIEDAGEFANEPL